MKIKHGKNFIVKSKRSVFIDKSVVIGDNVTVYENNRLEGDTVIGDGVTLYPDNRITDAVIMAGTTVERSIIENATVGGNNKIGPYSRLRPGACTGENVSVGNFVEIKNAFVGNGSKAGHLAYIGDADIGQNCNIGCGAIFVNYNGKIKQRSKVGDNCFIGSNCNIVAPVKIDDFSYICAGTTVTDDVPSEAFVIGRVRQETKEKRAGKYLKNHKGEN